MYLLRKHTYHLVGRDPDFRDIFVNNTLDPYKWKPIMKFNNDNSSIYYELKLNSFQAHKVSRIIKASNKNWKEFLPRRLIYIKWQSRSFYKFYDRETIFRIKETLHGFI